MQPEKESDYQNKIDGLIKIKPLNDNEFLKVRETLTRIGLVSRKESTKPVLWQSCHILHKQGNYYLTHFKQLFLLDGKDSKTNFDEDDRNRVVYIASLLDKWGLVSIIDRSILDKVNVIPLVIIPFSEKNQWDLKSKYAIGENTRYCQ